MRVPRFICDNPVCATRIFQQRMPQMAEPRAKTTRRCTRWILQRLAIDRGLHRQRCARGGGSHLRHLPTVNRGLRKPGAPRGQDRDVQAPQVHPSGCTQGTPGARAIGPVAVEAPGTDPRLLRRGRLQAGPSKPQAVASSTCAGSPWASGTSNTTYCGRSSIPVSSRPGSTHSDSGRAAKARKSGDRHPRHPLLERPRVVCVQQSGQHLVDESLEKTWQGRRRNRHPPQAAGLVFNRIEHDGLSDTSHTGEQHRAL